MAKNRHYTHNTAYFFVTFTRTFPNSAMNRLITPEFFHQEPQALAIALLGKVLRRKVQWQGKTLWLSARIIETEAYYRDEKASHSSLGFTAKTQSDVHDTRHNLYVLRPRQ